MRPVVRSQQMTNYRLDVLSCGHEVADYDNRQVKRRRCRQCCEASVTVSWSRRDGERGPVEVTKEEYVALEAVGRAALRAFGAEKEEF